MIGQLFERGRYAATADALNRMPGLAPFSALWTSFTVAAARDFFKDCYREIWTGGVSGHFSP
jgi:hypothetical protein